MGELNPIAIAEEGPRMWLIALAIGSLLFSFFATVIVCSRMNDPT